MTPRFTRPPASLFLRREAEAGNTIEPAPPVKLSHQEAPPYIQELLSQQFAAVSTRVVLRGQSTFSHNDMCARLFLSTEQANELYASNMQASEACAHTCLHHLIARVPAKRIFVGCFALWVCPSEAVAVRARASASVRACCCAVLAICFPSSRTRTCSQGLRPPVFRMTCFIEI